MGKSKEQCMVLIAKRLAGLNKNEKKTYLNNLKESIKDITGSEYGFLWLYDETSKLLKTENIEVPMEQSILETVLLSKKGLYENYVKSHKFFNNKIDNPLNINIKSVLTVPILSKDTRSVIGFILSMNSMDNLLDFQRYDLRSLALLDTEAQELIKCMNKNKEEKSKKEIESNQKIIELAPLQTKKTTNRKTKNELENELKEQAEKLITLENLLKLKEEELKEKEFKKKENQLVLVENNIAMKTPVTNAYELENILTFLTNEVTYLANENHAVYSLLEVIKNSLYDKSQLSLIDESLKSSQIINSFLDSFYNQERMPIKSKEFNSFQAFSSVINLYSRAFSDENITFNIFIDPLLPSKIISDVEKVKSIMIHLINNVKGLISKNGIAELMISYVEEDTSIVLSIKGIQPEEKKFSNLFKSKVVSNSLTTNSRGLGLSISSNLLNILNGKLKLASEGKNEHSFIALIPVKTNSVVMKKKIFKTKKPLKIAILLSKDDEYAYFNLRRYLDAFSIDKANIKVFYSYKKLSNLDISHFICFEKMLSAKIDMKRFPSITILKYSDTPLSTCYLKRISINELYVNSYYGMALQKILFPDVEVEEVTANTLLIEDTFFSKITNKFKH